MTTKLLNNRYQVIQVLGSGGFGETSLAEDIHLPSRRRFVIKELKPINNDPATSQLIQQRFEREAAILENLGESSNQIPKLYAYFPENGKFYLVQEWIQGQTLSSIIESQRKLSESVVKEILLSLLSVLDYVHSKGIIHRDIKPDNIILRSEDNKPVLIDFGAVKETIRTAVNPSGNPIQSIVIGTPGYMPSEQGIGRPVYATDIYSLGLTAIYLLTGIAPQELETDPQTGQILWQKYAAGISTEMVQILTQAIEPRPGDRYTTASKMLYALQSNQKTSFHTPKTSATISFSPTPYSPATTPISREIPNPVKQQKPFVIIGSVIIGGVIGAVAVSSLISQSQTPSPVTNNSGFTTETSNSAVLPKNSPSTEAVSPTPEVTPTPTSQPTIISNPRPDNNFSSSFTPPPRNNPIQNTPTPVFTPRPQPEINSNPETLFERQEKPDRKKKKKKKKKKKDQNNDSFDNFNNFNSSGNIPAFPTGVSRSSVEARLGKPRKDLRGLWPNTRAVIYEVVPNQIDLGYLFDRDTGRLRQTEVGFAENVDPQLMQSTLNGLLAGQATAEIKRGMQRVQQGQAEDFAFSQGGVKGQIIRQYCGSIYISVWEADLHDFVNPNSAKKC